MNRLHFSFVIYLFSQNEFNFALGPKPVDYWRRVFRLHLQSEHFQSMKFFDTSTWAESISLLLFNCSTTHWLLLPPFQLTAAALLGCVKAQERWARQLEAPSWPVEGIIKMKIVGNLFKLSPSTINGSWSWDATESDLVWEQTWPVSLCNRLNY